MRAIYSDGMLTEIQKRWAAGETAGEIALKIEGLNRNKVMGIVHRARARAGEQADELWPQRKPSGRMTVRKRKPDPFRYTDSKPPLTPRIVVRQQKVQEPWTPPVRPPLTAPILFFDRKATQCSFIADDPMVEGENTKCCGAPVTGEGSYCSWHHGIVYQKTDAGGRRIPVRTPVLTVRA